MVQKKQSHPQRGCGRSLCLETPALTDKIELQEDWVERTDNPPPKNATWMFRHFKSTRESPSAIMKNPSSMTWRTKTRRDFHTPDLKLSFNTIPADRASLYNLNQNSAGQRVDLPNKLFVNRTLLRKLKDHEPRLCNAHHLIASCRNESCAYDHDTVLSDDEFEALMYLSRCQVCPKGSACTTEKCIRGHLCPDGDDCKYGRLCKWYKFHGVDTTIVAR